MVYCLRVGYQTRDSFGSRSRLAELLFTGGTNSPGGIKIECDPNNSELLDDQGSTINEVESSKWRLVIAAAKRINWRQPGCKN